MANVEILIEGIQHQDIAEDKMQQIYRDYHPAGYGTSLELWNNGDGTFTIKGSRSSTCD